MNLEVQGMGLLSYLLYFGVSVVLLVVFSLIYTAITPYNEMDMIRKGQGAACVSLAGTVLGLSLTLAANAIYQTHFFVFIVWALIAMVVQLLGYMLIVSIIGNVKEHMMKNNTAVGGLIGLTGLALGIINTGCLS